MSLVGSVFLQNVQKEITERHILNLIHPQDVQKGTERQVMIYIDVILLCYCTESLNGKDLPPTRYTKGKTKTSNNIKCSFIVLLCGNSL